MIEKVRFKELVSKRVHMMVQRQALIACLVAVLLLPDAASASLRREHGARQSTLHAVHADPQVAVVATPESTGSTALLLNPTGLQHLVEASTSFLHQIGHMCDGQTDKLVDTSVLNLNPADMGNVSTVAYRKLHSYCHRVCSTDKQCQCYNIENATCNMQMGKLLITKDHLVDAFVRVAMRPLPYLTKSKAGLMTPAVMDFSIIPNAKCRLSSTLTSGLASKNGNITKKMGLLAGNLTHCQKLCVQEACSCLELSEAPDANDPLQPESFKCDLYIGKMDKTVFYEMRDGDKAKLKMLTLVPTGTHHELVSTVTPQEMTKKAGILEALQKAAIITIPVLLCLIIAWVCFGAPIKQLLTEYYRKARHTAKPLNEMTLEERKCAHSNDSAKEKMKHNVSVFLQYRRDARNFMGFAADASRPDQVSYPQYDFPKGGDYPYRTDMDWQGVWWIRFRHFFTIGGTTLRNCVKPAVFIGSVAALWAWAEAVFFTNPDGSGESASAEHFRENMAQVSKLHTHLVTPATFVVMFSLNEALNRWQNVLTTMWAMQDPIQVRCPTSQYGGHVFLCL